MANLLVYGQLTNYAPISQVAELEELITEIPKETEEVPPPLLSRNGLPPFGLVSDPQGDGGDAFTPHILYTLNSLHPSPHS